MMSEAIRKPSHSEPESYQPKRPEILSVAKNALRSAQGDDLPVECILRPKDRVAMFSGERWPYSNVEPAVYGALGLFYGRTGRRDGSGALVNDDMEYAVHNVLTGHAFGLFFCLPEDAPSMAAYGLTSRPMALSNRSTDEIIRAIMAQIVRGNLVHIDEGNGPFDYLIWGYRDGGDVLLGHLFEHGNDMQNNAYDFDHPTELKELTQRLSDANLFRKNGEKPGGITVYAPDGEKLDRETLYRKALLEGRRMLTQVEAPPAMDFARVHFGYGQAIYDEWVRQLEQANAEQGEAFYFASPVFPHFIALYENRLQLHKFLKQYAEMNVSDTLSRAADLCGRLKDLAVEAAQIGFENERSKPEILAMTNNERRSLLIHLLKRCRTLELEIAEQIGIFADSPESYGPKRPEILSAAKRATANQKENGASENALPGIPPMRYGDPSPVCFIGTVMRLMDFLHDPICQDELFALSGAGLCFPWREASNCDEVSIIPEIPRRTFAALGYEYEYLYEPDISVSPRRYAKDFYIAKIKKSIDAGRPVVGFGFTHQNFACLITGYYKGGDGLSLRAFWTPEGSPDGYDTADHDYATEAWYETCYGIVVVGEKTRARLSGAEAYRHIMESADLFSGMRMVESQKMEYAMGASSFDRMRDWLLDDAEWAELSHQEAFLKPCGLLLLDYYRANLREYLKRLGRQFPGVVNEAAVTALDRFGECFPGSERSQLHMNECVDPAITDFSMLRERAVREKVAAYVERLKRMDGETFACLMKKDKNHTGAAQTIPAEKPEGYGPKRPEILKTAERAQRESAYPEDFILPNQSTAIPPEIRHYGPAYVPFANEFSHFLDYTGQGYGFLYDGDWCRDRSYTIADVLSGHAMEPSNLFSKERVELFWRTVGFPGCRTFSADPDQDDFMSEPDMKQAIRYALYRLKQPVILPQESRWWGSVVIGYRDCGNVLVIYHHLPYFMDTENNARPQIEEISGWYHDGASLFMVGAREKTPSPADIYLEGIRQIRSCLESNIRGEKRHFSDEWEAFLRLRVEEMIAEVRRTHIVPGGEHGPLAEDASDDAAWEFICRAHDSTWCNMAERRYCVMNFFRQAKEYFPEAGNELQALDDHFWRASEIMGSRDTGYGTEVGDPVDIEIFKNPEVRGRMADCVRRFREADAMGLAMVEEVLKQIRR